MSQSVAEQLGISAEDAETLTKAAHGFAWQTLLQATRIYRKFSDVVVGKTGVQLPEGAHIGPLMYAAWDHAIAEAKRFDDAIIASLPEDLKAKYESARDFVAATCREPEAPAQNEVA